MFYKLMENNISKSDLSKVITFLKKKLVSIGIFQSYQEIILD